jgi:predicted deacylase
MEANELKTWTIAGHTLQPGQKQRVILHPNMENYEMPGTMICGTEDGMTLIVTAGIHSGEYPGVAAAARLANEIDATAFKGRLLLVHCVNTSGFWAKSPGRVPEDGVNLNADYPGRPDGTTGERIADYFVKEIFPGADFIIDLHSGGSMEPLTPCLFFPVAAGEEVRKTAFTAAQATDIPYLIASMATSGEYSYAATAMGIPGLLLERGHCGHCRQEWIDAYHRDLELLLTHFGMCAMKHIAPACPKIVCDKTIYLVSAHKGLWRPAIEEGQRVRKGDLLGHVENFWGEHIGEYRAEDDATIFYYTSGLAINPGDHLVAYGLAAHMRHIESAP